MDNLEKTCEHNLLVNAGRERIKEGDDMGRCVACHETVKINYEYHQIGEYLYGKADKYSEEIPSEINCFG